jgi:hypothetical protein
MRKRYYNIFSIGYCRHVAALSTRRTEKIQEEDINLVELLQLHFFGYAALGIG